MDVKADISWEDFEKIDMRVGTIRDAEPLKKARKPAYKLTIDFGSHIGIRQSSAQITALYSSDALINRQVIAVLNFPPKRIAGFKSECLVMGVYRENGDVVLIQPSMDAENGQPVG